MSRPRAAHFGRHQRRDAVVLEIGERPGACTLALVAMNGGRLDAGALQLLGEAIGAVLVRVKISTGTSCRP
ncbi:MAG: hypothetical protein WDM77_19890 [Steroidobacteraceae bacterium]